jgi:hypothetical protein
MEQQVRAAIVATTGHNADGDGVMQAADGAEFELYGGTMFSLHGLTPSICKVIFRAAQRTNAYIIPTGGGDGGSLKIKGTRGAATKEFMPIKVVADPRSLCQVLEGGYQTWRDYADHVHKAINGSPPRR